MNIVLDGIIFEQQAKGGIPRIYQEILPRICNLDPTVQFSLVTHGPIRSEWPPHAQINHHRLWAFNRYIQPGKYLWSFKKRVRSWIAGLSLTNQTEEIWHSTHFTLPYKWKGPVLISAYDLLIERFASIFDEPLYHQIRAEMRRCIVAADGVICISETTKKEIIDFYQIDSSKLYVVPLAQSQIFQRLPLRDDKDEIGGLMRQKPFFLYVGNRERYKNFDTVLAAYEHWSGKEEVDLVVVGREWTTIEKKWLIEKKLDQNVELIGRLDDESLCVLYNRAQALIYPSLYEGFGLPLLEAMACGCPIIASHIPSSVEVAGTIPIYFEPTQSESLRNAFDVALDEVQNRQRINAGYTRLNDYSWEKTAQQTLGLYRQFSS